MAIRKQDIIKIINDYRQGRDTKALPPGFRLEDYDAQVQYLNNLVANTPGDEIQIYTPIDAQRIGAAVNSLSGFSNIGTTEETIQKIERGREMTEELYRRSQTQSIPGLNTLKQVTGKIKPESGLQLFDTAPEKKEILPNYDTSAAEVAGLSNVPEEIAYARGVRTLGMLKKTRADWLRKRDYVYFPIETPEYWNKNPTLYQIYAMYGKKSDFSFYKKLAEALPPDQKERVNSLLNEMRDANKIFALDKERYTVMFDSIIGKLEDRTKNLGKLADNSIINMSDLTEAEKEALTQIEAFGALPAQTKAFKQTSDYAAEITNIINTFRQPLQAEVAKFNSEQEKKKLQAGIADKFNKQHMTYDQLTDREKRFLDAEGKKLGMSGDRYYSDVIGKRDLTQDFEPQPPTQINKTPQEEEVSREINVEAELNRRQQVAEQSQLEANPPPTEEIKAQASMPKASETPASGQETGEVSTTLKASLPLRQQPPSPVAETAEPIAPIGRIDITALPVAPEPQITTTKSSDGTVVTTVIPDTYTGVTQTEIPEFSAPTVTPIPTAPEKLSPEEMVGHLRNEFGFNPYAEEKKTPIYRPTPTAEEVVDNMRDEAILSDRIDFATGKESPLATPSVESFESSDWIADFRGELETTDRSLLAADQPGIYDNLATPSTAGMLVRDTDEMNDRLTRSVFGLRILSRAEKEHLSIITQREQIFKKHVFLAFQSGNPLEIIKGITSMPSLLGPGYEVQIWRWLKNKGRSLSKNIVDGVSEFISRKYYNSKFYSHWSGVIAKGIKNYKAWERKSKIGGLIKRIRFIPKLAKREKKKNGAYVAAEIAIRLLKGAISFAQNTAKFYVNVVENVKNIVQLPKRLVNSPTSFYKRVKNFAQNADIEKIVDDAKKGGSIGLKYVRVGGMKTNVMMGEVASIIKGIGRPIGALIDALPMAGLTGLAFGIGAGSLPMGIAVGSISLLGKTVDNVLRRDPSDILAFADRFDDKTKAMLQFEEVLPEALKTSLPQRFLNLISGGLHKVAQAVRFPYKFIQTHNLANTPLSKAINSGDASLMEKAAADINLKGGQFSKFHSGVRMFNTGLFLGSVGYALGGIPGGLIAAGVGVGGQFVADKLTNRFYKWMAGPGKSSIFGLPIMKTLDTFVDIAGLGHELSVIQKKYNWNFGEYFKNEFKGLNILGRTSNWLLGLKGLWRLPQVITAWFKAPFFANFAAKYLASGNIFNPNSIAFPAIVGWLAGLGTLALLGVPLTPTVIGLSLAGAAVGATGATLVSLALVGSGPPGWIILAVGFVGSLVGGGIGYWIDKTFNNVVNRAMSMLNLFVNGIQALLELFAILLHGGPNLTNVIPFILTLSSLFTTLNYLQSMDGTNACTTTDECPTDGSNPFISQGSTQYLYYYDLNVISKDSTNQEDNIRKVLALLGDDPTVLDKAFGSRKKYIYIGNTSDTYINDQVAIIAISKDQLYSDATMAYLINQSVATSEDASN